MTAVLEDLTLGTLQAAIRTEFGGSTALDPEIRSKINDAIALLWQSEKTWRWALRSISLISLAQVTTTATVGEAVGSTDINVATVGAVAGRWTVKAASAPDEYLLYGTAPPLLLLTTPLATAIPAGTSVTSSQTWLELPPDFAYMHTLRTEGGQLPNKEPVHVTPWVMEKIRKGLFLVVPGSPGFYTIAQDPVPFSFNAPPLTTYQPNRQFIQFWPPPSINTKWDGFYYSVPHDLVDSVDITEVPRGFRKHLQYKAMALLAAKLRDLEAAQYYEAQAVIGMEGLINANAFADDSDARIRGQALTLEQLIDAGMMRVR